MIRVDNLSYTYGNGVQALRNITAVFPREHIFAIMGRSGSGKTTLLNCIARFLRPQQGAVFWEKTNILDLDEKRFRSILGVVFQRLNLFPHLTVLGNMTLAPRRLRGCSRQSAEAEALEMLDRLGIAELAESYPAQISGGQAQRVAIARGLMLKPKVMLLDEPTSALDARTTSEFAQWLRELKSATSFIVVTHDLSFAGETARNGMFMVGGRIRECGRMEDIFKHVKKEAGTYD
ncbi:MAG: ATP-binding cassette domain-containing protein [Victivallaceae bacterium]|nr:ATP-binding cassette domain-containing protein [Victivallaceae bacterium]